MTGDDHVRPSDEIAPACERGLRAATPDRRSFLASLGLMALAPPAETRSAELTVLVDEVIGTISPLIYGQFAEHIGRLIYGGAWVGADSSTPNRDGYRLDTLEALARVRPSVFRWPGGCFADTYHWEDGIGPASDRKRQHNHWWLGDEPNTFGTNEFVGWCERLKAEPYLSVNVGTGSVSEALHWLEYCNGTGNTHYANLRARHGHPRPHGIRWWGIGNENWGCGGLLKPAEYAQRFREYAIYFKRMGLSTDLELVGVGHTDDNWNQKFLEGVAAGLPYLDHLSIHRYFRRGHSTNFSDAEYTELMLDVSDFKTTIQAAIAAIDQFEPIRAKIPVFGPLKPKPIGLIIDEWGAWHDDARLEDGFRQPGALREALFAASCLNLFHEFAARITMSNVSQVINCLQSLILTDEQSMVLTPTYHVYEMYLPHQGASALRVDLTSSPSLGSGARSQPSISVSASKVQGTVFLTIVNQDPNQPTDVSVQLRGGTPADVTAKLLSGESAKAQNTFNNPNAVTPKLWTAEVQDAAIRFQLPAASVGAASVRVG